jgi:hypothetical protein
MVAGVTPARGKASMKKDLRELVDRLRRATTAMQEWNAAISGGSIDEITEDVICISETKMILGNVTSIRTDEGLVLVDTGSRETAEIVLKAIRTWDEAPIHTTTRGRKTARPRSGCKRQAPSAHCGTSGRRRTLSKIRCNTMCEP